MGIEDMLPRQQFWHNLSFTLNSFWGGDLTQKAHTVLGEDPRGPWVKFPANRKPDVFDV
jgi:pyruvate/oxaloacetate carboxyltransferase